MNYYYHCWLSHYTTNYFLAKFYNITVLRRPQGITPNSDGLRKRISITIEL